MNNDLVVDDNNIQHTEQRGYNTPDVQDMEPSDSHSLLVGYYGQEDAVYCTSQQHVSIFHKHCIFRKTARTLRKLS